MIFEPEENIITPVHIDEPFDAEAETMPLEPEAAEELEDEPHAQPESKPAAKAKAKVKPERIPLIGGDKHIWGIYLTLLVISIVELFSASSREVAGSSAFGVFGPLVHHISHLVLGLAVVLVMQRIHYGKLAKGIPVFVLVSIIMAVYVLFCGERINGAARSFTLLISIQPAEFIKISTVFIIALILTLTQSENNQVRNIGVCFCLLFVAVFAGLLISDGLTNTAIVMVIALAMMLIGGMKIKQFVLLITIGAIVGFIGFKLISSGVLSFGRSETWTERFTTYSDSIPVWERPVTPDNAQEMYSYMAQANGGVLGVFPGNSRETSRLPLAFSDFIYAIIIEDMGLVGGIAVLLLFLWLMARASAIASRCHNIFAAVLVLGMSVMIVVQALVHMAIVTGVMPVTGQPLPLISKGGTSIVITSLAFGVMLSVSRFGVRTGRKASARDDDTESMPANMRAVNPSQIS